MGDEKLRRDPVVIEQLADHEGKPLFVVGELMVIDRYGCCFARPDHKPGDGGTEGCKQGHEISCMLKHAICVQDLEQYKLRLITRKLTS